MKDEQSPCRGRKSLNREGQKVAQHAECGAGDTGDWAGVRDARSLRRDYRSNATLRGRGLRTGNGEEEVDSFIRLTPRSV